MEISKNLSSKKRELFKSEVIFDIDALEEKGHLSPIQTSTFETFKEVIEESKKNEDSFKIDINRQIQNRTERLLKEMETHQVALTQIQLEELNAF